jgi:hypothetical protein
MGARERKSLRKVSSSQRTPRRAPDANRRHHDDCHAAEIFSARAVLVQRQRAILTRLSTN